MYGIFGAEAGQVEGYGGYSGGLKGLVWDQVTLDRFIADPQSVSPNTNMIYPPVRDAEERKKIIEFLKSLKSGKVEQTSTKPETLTSSSLSRLMSGFFFVCVSSSGTRMLRVGYG